MSPGRAADNRWMRAAIGEARGGVLEGQSPFGAVVVRGDAVVARGHNEVLATNDPTRHAEIVAISRAGRRLERYDLSDCAIYATGEPCPMCFTAIHWARIPRILFGISTDDAATYGFHELRIPDRELARMGGLSVEIDGDVLADEVRELFEEWRAGPNPITY